jgi:DNA-binding NtrC family response regulator
VQSGTCRVILGDVHLPGIHAYEFLDRLLRVDPGVHVIIITKEYTLESALEAIRRGAPDFSLALEARTRRCGLAVRPAEAGVSAKSNC